MTIELILYARKQCCLCAEMKETVRRVIERCAASLEEIDIDSSAELQAKYSDEVPVLFINGRKAFKYRVTAKELARKLRREAPRARHPGRAASLSMIWRFLHKER
jgi:glutaredoxin